MDRIVLKSILVWVALLFSLPAYSLSEKETTILKEIRNQIFGGSRLSAAIQQTTISGQEPPVFSYQLDDRALIIWRIKPNKAQAFSNSIGIQPPFTLAQSLPISEKQKQARFIEWLSVWDKNANSYFSRFLPKQQYYVIADIANTSGSEQGSKVEFKTFVSIAGSKPLLYRFASFKAFPGNDLLEMTNTNPSDLIWQASETNLSGHLNEGEYQLSLTIPFKLNRKGNAQSYSDKQFSRAYLDAAQRTFGPQWAQSRYYYDGSSVSAQFQKVKGKDIDLSYSFPWSEFVRPVPSVLIPNRSMRFLVQPVTSPVNVAEFPPGPETCISPYAVTNASELYACLVAMALGNPSEDINAESPEVVFGTLFSVQNQMDPSKIPALYYALQDLYQGLNIYAGYEKPKLFFSLKDDPKTIFINFEIRDDQVEAFKSAYLPQNFELAKIRFYPEQRKSVYAISLNIYESVGQNLDSYRAEWSTYVINPEEENPKPRFSVIEAQTTAGGFDPLIALERFETFFKYPDDLPLNPADLPVLIEPRNENFSYTFNQTDGIQVLLANNNGVDTVEIDIAYPPAHKRFYTKPLKSWMEANDFVYWGEVADVLKYDEQVMFADLMVFRAQPSDIIHDSTFAQYVKPKPLPIIVWLGGQDIALEPWGSLDITSPQEIPPTAD